MALSVQQSSPTNLDDIHRSIFQCDFQFKCTVDNATTNGLQAATNKQVGGQSKKIQSSHAHTRSRSTFIIQCSFPIKTVNGQCMPREMRRTTNIAHSSHFRLLLWFMFCVCSCFKFGFHWIRSWISIDKRPYSRRLLFSFVCRRCTITRAHLNFGSMNVYRICASVPACVYNRYESVRVWGKRSTEKAATINTQNNSIFIFVVR